MKTPKTEQDIKRVKDDLLYEKSRLNAFKSTYIAYKNCKPFYTDECEYLFKSYISVSEKAIIDIEKRLKKLQLKHNENTKSTTSRKNSRSNRSR